jgi:hypothetical protein
MKDGLITITTCNRLLEVKKNIVPFLQFCSKNEGFDFVLSLDGEDKDYLEFCDKYNIPLIYSKKREGVGLSKNRVLKLFPNYKYYFFVDDDVEIVDDSIFKIFIEIHKKYDYNHLSYSVNKNPVLLNKEEGVIGGFIGSGAFNFFTRKAIEKVGGWHTLFSKYKRYGHTEYSYRIFFKKLNPYPFVAIKNIEKYILINDPPHVTTPDKSIIKNDNELIKEEQEMINSKQSYFPLKTLSEFYFNGINVSLTKLHPDLNKGRYYLLEGIDKIKAWGNYFFHRFKIKKNPLCLFLSVILYPNNNHLKHWIKQKLKYAKKTIGLCIIASL